MTWIPLKTRPATEEERRNGMEDVLNCQLPDDGEDVLVSTKYDGVRMDTFYNDSDGCYFESCDIDEVRAWMRLPEPYEEVTT